jgi:hypothetical protein
LAELGERLARGAAHVNAVGVDEREQDRERIHFVDGREGAKDVREDLVVARLHGVARHALAHALERGISPVP